MALEQVNFSSQLIALTPVIVGGLLAACGSFAAQLVGHYTKQRADKKQRQRDRITHLFDLILENEQWLENKQAYFLYNGEVTNEGPPVARAEIFARIYFPELAASIKVMNNASRNYIVWITQTKQKHLKDNTYNTSTGYSEVYKPYHEATLSALEELQALVTTRKMD